MTNTGERARQPNRRLKRVLIVLSSLVLFAMLSTLTASVICRFVFGRAEQDQKLLRAYTPELEAAYPRRQVHFDSGDNTLEGYLYEAQTPEGLVVIAHGMWDGSGSHLSEALYFLDHNWSVFAFDGTGTGGSTGRGIVGLQQMVLDVLAAIDYLETEERSQLPLVLYGHSMGGYAVIVAAGESEAVEAVVSISGFDSPMGLMLQMGRQRIGEVATVGYPFLYLHNWLTFGPYTDRSAAEVIDQSDAAFLIVYGAEDDIVVEETSIYGCREEICNPEADFRLVTEPLRNGHSAAWLSEDAVAYRDTLLGELDAQKEAHGGRLPPEEFARFYGQIDQERLFSLDEEFMERVLEFYRAAVENQ